MAILCKPVRYKGYVIAFYDFEHGEVEAHALGCMIGAGSSKAKAFAEARLSIDKHILQLKRTIK